MPPTIKAGGDRAPIEIPLYSQCAAAGTAPPTYGWISDGYYELIEARRRHSANGGAAAAVDVQKTPSGTALGAGVSMLASTFDLTANANSITGGVKSASNAGLSATKTNRQLAPGDAIGVVTSGTLTALAGLQVTVVLVRIRPNRVR